MKLKPLVFFSFFTLQKVKEFLTVFEVDNSLSWKYSELICQEASISKQYICPRLKAYHLPFVVWSTFENFTPSKKEILAHFLSAKL